MTVNNGMVMNSWYDIMSLGSNVKFDEAQVQKSTKRIFGVVNEEAKSFEGDYKRVFIGGFSQGCCMALNTALSCEHTLGGVVGLSGHIFPQILDIIE